MHFVKKARYVSGYKLVLTFEDGSVRQVDLEDHLDGEVFEPLRDVSYFRRVRVNRDIDTVVWPNEADFSPDLLYEIGVPQPKGVLAAGSSATDSTDHTDKTALGPKPVHFLSHPCPSVLSVVGHLLSVFLRRGIRPEGRTTNEGVGQRACHIGLP